MTDRKRQFGAWAAGTLIGVPLLYVLSFGPACWWFSDWKIGSGDPARVAPQLYWPIGSIAVYSHGGMTYRLISWYSTLLTPSIRLPANSDGDLIMLERDEIIIPLELDSADETLNFSRP